MDVVVRTPHGDADIEIVSAPGTTTLGDIIASVTGQAPPPVARVDGRAVSASEQLTELGLVVGSLVDARPSEVASVPPPPGATHVNVMQLTGRGAGSINSLTPGRYRIGPGRRLNADEMIDAPVETPAFEVRVTESGAATVIPGPQIGGPLGVLTPTLDGALFDRELTWNGGRLSVGGRVFELEAPALDPPRRELPAADSRGSIPYQRPPRTATEPDLLGVGARRRAITASPGLWARRRTDPGAYAIPFGLLPDGTTEAVVDFQRHRGAALVGSDRFGAGLARTLIVEATTIHGPSDLEVVIASTPERLGQWDWAKWLPHARRGDPSTRPALLADADDLDAWASSLVGTGDTAASAASDDPQADPNAPEVAVSGDAAGAPRWQAPKPGTLGPGPGRGQAVTTLLVLDDLSLWSRRDSPLRSVLVDPPPHLRIIALCGGMHEAPGMCTALIEERRPDEAFAESSAEAGTAALFGSIATLHLRLGQSPETVSDVRPALVEPGLALRIASSMAALDDLDLARPAVAPTSLAPPSLSELIDIQMAANDASDELTVTIGLIDRPTADGIGATPRERRPVRLDLAASRVTLLSSDDRDAHDTLIAGCILGATATRRPDQLAVLTVGPKRPAWHAEVPHIAGHVDASSPDDPARLLHRVAHVLSQQPGLEVLVVIEDAFDSGQPLQGEAQVKPNDLLTGMLELADSLSRVHLLATTEHRLESVPDAITARCGITVRLSGPAHDPRGEVTSDNVAVGFVGPTRVADSATGSTTTPSAAPALLIRPFVFGRAMTPLERRVSRAIPRRDANDTHDPATQQIAQRIAAGALSAATDASTAAGDSLLPPPLATSIESSTLFAQHPGDAVPIGLIDRPERADSEAYWWEPGSRGSLIAIGSPRSGMTHLGDLIATGIAARLSADDVHVYAIEPLPQRRRAFDALPHTAAVVTTDEPSAVQRTIATVTEILDARRGQPTDELPAVVLVIGDLARLCRWLPDDTVDDALEALATIGADGPDLRVNLICITTRADDLGPLVRLAGDRLVGTVSDAADRTRLGVPAPGPTDRHSGRCWSVDIDRRVQLATPPDSVELEVARLAPEPARVRPPRQIADRSAP